MKTRIESADDVKVVAAVLHDARFTEDKIQFDETSHGFNLECWLPEPKGTAKRAKRPWKAYRLSISNVLACKAKATEKVRYYELSTILFSERNRRLDLISHYGIRISLQVGELNGSLTETGAIHDGWD